MEADDITIAAADDEVVVAADTAGSCELVTVGDVEASTGLAIVSVDEDPMFPTNGCVFGFGLSADVFLATGGHAELMFTSYMDLVDGGTAELIPDIGVAAVYSSSYRGLAVDAGQGRFLAVGLNGGYPEELAEPRAALLALASAATAQL